MKNELLKPKRDENIAMAMFCQKSIRPMELYDRSES